MASPPPTLPITNTQSTDQSQPPIATPAFRAFITRISDSARLAFSQRRPWSDLIDRSSLSRPDSLSEAATRVRKNLSYFRINYLTLIASILALSLLTHPFSLIVLLCLLSSWSLLYLFRPSDPPLVLFGRTFTDRETLGILTVVSFIVIFLTSVGSLIVSALMLGFGIVCVHGAFRVPEDLFLDEQEPATSGFLSFIGNASSTASAAPVVAARA